MVQDGPLRIEINILESLRPNLVTRNQLIHGRFVDEHVVFIGFPCLEGLSDVFWRVQANVTDTLAEKQLLTSEEVLLDEVLECVDEHVLEVRSAHVQHELLCGSQHTVRLTLIKYVDLVTVHVSCDHEDEVFLVVLTQLELLLTDRHDLRLVRK